MLRKWRVEESAQPAEQGDQRLKCTDGMRRVVVKDEGVVAVNEIGCNEERSIWW